MERPGYINAATLLSKINDDRAKPRYLVPIVRSRRKDHFVVVN